MTDWKHVSTDCDKTEMIQVHKINFKCLFSHAEVICRHTYTTPQHQTAVFVLVSNEKNKLYKSN